MEKKIAVINGASGGIGSAIAEKLATDYHLILLGRNESKLKKLVHQIKTNTPASQAEYVKVDFTDLTSIQKTADFLEVHKGNIKILVNSMGMVPVGMLHEVSEIDWENAIQVSLMSAIRLVKYFSPLMCEKGSIVLVNGVLAIQSDAKFVISSTITGALRNFAKAISKDLSRRNIRVNSVLPGATKTNLWEEITKTLGKEFNVSSEDLSNNIAKENPLLRIALPEDIANAVVFLTQDSSSYINGTMLTVDGGANSST